MNNLNSIKNFSPVNQLVLTACSPTPNISFLQEAISKINNWEEASDKLIKKGVAPLFLEILLSNTELIEQTSKQSATINKNVVPLVIVSKLKQAYLKTVTRSMILYDAFREIAVALNEQGIKAVALKGIYLAEHLYPKLGLRQFSDIDLLFRKEDISRALIVFKKLGYQSFESLFSENITQYRNIAHLPPLVRNGICIEAHIGLLDHFSKFTLPIDELIERSVKTTINKCDFNVLELHDLLIYLCLHLDKHFNGDHIQFYSFADIAHLIYIKNAEIDWELLFQRSKSYNSSQCVLEQLLIAKNIFNTSIVINKNQGLAKLPDPEIISRINEHLNNSIHLKKTTTRTHLRYINNIRNFNDKVRYLIEVILPSKDYMVKAYKIKHKKWYWVWYPYRWWKGLKGTF